MGRGIRKAFFAVVPYRERWSVAYSFTGWRKAALWRATTPKPPAGRFVADPFVWQHEGKTFCLVEDYSFRERIGRISAFEIDKYGASEPEVVLAEPFHLSFPYLSADSPLSDAWVPHPENPVKIDPAGARNAGLLRDGGKLYRAGQIQGFDQYGVGIRLFEICSMPPEEYRERPIAEIHPEFRDGLLGTHHLSSTGTVTVVDGYRREFVW